MLGSWPGIGVPFCAAATLAGDDAICTSAQHVYTSSLPAGTLGSMLGRVGHCHTQYSAMDWPVGASEGTWKLVSHQSSWFVPGCPGTGFGYADSRGARSGELLIW